MDYFNLLTKIIKKAGLTYEKATERCEDYGESYNLNYISTNKNRGSIPPDNFSRAIAKVCGQNEDLLVTQAFYDKSPKAYKDMFNSIIVIVKTMIWMSLSPQSSESAREKERQKLDDMMFGEWMEFDLSNITEQIDNSFTALMNNDKFAEKVNELSAGEVKNAFSTYRA